MDTTTIAPLTTSTLLVARGWQTGKTENLAGEQAGERIERTHFVPSAPDAAALRELLGQLPDAPVLVCWEIARRLDAQTGDFSHLVRLVAQAGPESAHYGEDRCPSTALLALAEDLEMFGAPATA